MKPCKKWLGSHLNQCLTIILFLGVMGLRLCVTRDEVQSRVHITAYIEDKLREQLKMDKGTGCKLPVLDPFAKEMLQFYKKIPKVKCEGQDWVKCHLSECKVINEILDTYTDITCKYQDIIYESDLKYHIGRPVEVRGAGVYHLRKSDHVKISCVASKRQILFVPIPRQWTGLASGFRSTVYRHPAPKGREHTINILIFGFDSAARNGFIRRMPDSYKYLTETLNATILKGYNIVGDGTPAALFPILTGKNELELPDARKKMNNNKSCDEMPFIFYKLKEDGYRTAYLEDMPEIGTFQYRFTGFRRQPADHYLRAFLLEKTAQTKSWWNSGSKQYCVGDTPLYQLMMNLTHQFLLQDGKKFAFTFVADITHDDFNMITTADDAFVDFLKKFESDGFMEDTMLIVMGDHGPRYANERRTLQGKLEERLPLMALVLPELLRAARPEALPALRQNVDALTTPHDIYATLLDAMDLRGYWNPYKIDGADLPRGMTLFQPIPRDRSCSEAGIEPHWCACVVWENVSESNPLYRRTAEALVDYINFMTAPHRRLCAERNLTSVSWVMMQLPNKRMLSFVEAKDTDGYVGRFAEQIRVPTETYQVKLTVDPGKADFEATILYLVDKNLFQIDARDVSRTNRYRDDPACISYTYPHLNPYCYCVSTESD